MTEHEGAGASEHAERLKRPRLPLVDDPARILFD